MDVTIYLDRINYRGSLEPSAETLRRLHRAHMLAVPFENLDIHLGREILLEEERVILKIVRERRGGFCYELNGAFGALLRTLGFKVEMLAASVAREAGGFGPQFDHMALLVAAGERWLADVGFGDSFLEPLVVDERDEQVQENGAFRIKDDDEHLIMERRLDGEWHPQYRFTLQPFELADYAGMCRYHQTSPDSHFTQRRTISRATTEGRVTLTGKRLIMTERGERQERIVRDDKEYAEALRDYFGVELEPPPQWLAED